MQTIPEAIPFPANPASDRCMARRLLPAFRFSAILPRMFELLNQVGNLISSTCDEWCLHLWEVVGTWFAGFATFAAVLVSLVLARRAGVRLSVSARVLTVFTHGAEPPFPEVLHIKVRNLGGLPVMIEGTGWRRRPWSRLHGYQEFNVVGHPRPPATVQPGGACYFTLPLLNPGIDWEVSFLKDFVGRWPRISVHFVRVIAWTPAGYTCSAFLDPNLKKWLIERADTLKQAPSAPVA